MDIGEYHGQWTMDAEALTAIITGKIIWKRCFTCERGLEWVDGDLGIVVSAKYVEENMTEENSFQFYQDTCEDCKGVGFLLVAFPE